MTIQIIPVEYIARAWNDGARKLGDAMRRNDVECTPQQLKMRLMRGELILLHLPPEAWAAVAFVTYPNSRALDIVAAYGPGETTPETFAELREFAERGGATMIECAGDEAATRLYLKLGFELAYCKLRMKL